MCPDLKENAPSIHGRNQGVDPTSDSWQNILTDGSGAMLVKATIAAVAGTSNVSITSPIVIISGTAVVVNITQSLSIPVNVSQVSPIVVNVSQGTNVPVNVSQASPIVVNVSQGANIPVNISAASPLTVNVTNTLVTNITAISALTVNVTGTIVSNITASSPLTVNVTNTVVVNNTQTVPFVVNVSQGANIPVNISAASPLTVNVTNTLVTNITAASPLTVNVTNNLNITNTLVVNVTGGTINISAASPLTVNVTAGRIFIRDGSALFNVDLAVYNAGGVGLMPCLISDVNFNLQGIKNTGETYSFVASTDNTLANAKYIKTDSSGTAFTIPQRTSQTLLFQSQAFTTTATINSTNTFDCTRYRALVIYLDMSKVGTVTDIIIRAQFDRGSTNFYTYAKDEWTDLRYVSAQMPITEVVTVIEPVGTTFRMQAFANGVTNTSNQILLSAWVEGLS